MVDGNPAISYFNGTRDYSPGSLKYVRAVNASGTAWDTSITVDVGAGYDNSLQVVNSNPAIAYSNQSGNLKYVRATNESGSAWGTPNTLDNRGSYTSLQIVLRNRHSLKATSTGLIRPKMFGLSHTVLTVPSVPWVFSGC